MLLQHDGKCVFSTKAKERENNPLGAFRLVDCFCGGYVVIRSAKFCVGDEGKIQIDAWGDPALHHSNKFQFSVEEDYLGSLAHNLLDKYYQPSLNNP